MMAALSSSGAFLSRRLLLRRCRRSRNTWPNVEEEEVGQRCKKAIRATGVVVEGVTGVATDVEVVVIHLIQELNHALGFGDVPTLGGHHSFRIHAHYKALLEDLPRGTRQSQ